MLEAIYNKLQAERPAHTHLVLSVSGGYLYTCEEEDIPRGAIDCYVPFWNKERCLEIIEESIEAGYKYDV